MKILILSDGVSYTGLARVAHALADGLLAKRHEISLLATNYAGDPHPYPYRIYPAGSDVYGFAKLPAIIQAERPEAIIAIQDYWIVNQWLDITQQLPYRPRFIAYCPVDGQSPEKHELTRLERADCIVAYTQFAKAEMILAGIDKHIEVIPHGIDHQSFYPIADKAAIREQLGLSKDDFIVFNGNRLQPRKNIEATIEGFCQFAIGKSNVHLYLHSEGIRDGYSVSRIYSHYRNLYGLPEGLLIRAAGNAHPNVSTETLNTVYNLADVGINTAAGEGWGLVSCEQALCGIPQIVPEHTVFPEIWGGDAYYVKPRLTTLTRDHLLTYFLVGASDVAQVLETVYRDQDRAKQMGAKAQARFSQRKFDWGVIAQQFSDLLRPQQRPIIIYKDNQPLEGGETLPLPYERYEGGIFNPGVVWSEAEQCYLGFARAEELPFSLYSRDYTESSAKPYFFKMDRDLNIFQHRELDIVHHDKPMTRMEDWRPFFDKYGRCYLSHTYWRKNESIRMGMSTFVEDVSPSLIFVKQMDSRNPMQKVEKNWGFFLYQGAITCLYSIVSADPIQYYDHSRIFPIKSGFRFPSFAPYFEGCYISLSSHPVRFDKDHYFFVYHCRRNGIYHHWGVLLNQDLEWVCCTAKPLMVGGKARGHRSGFLTVHSAHVANDEIRLFYGEGDMFSGVARVPISKIQWVGQ